MGQTLLVVVAILVFSLFALNQHRARAGAEISAMGREIELAATELANARLLAATSLAFDEGVIGLTGFTVDPAVLTPPGSFGAGNDPDEDENTPADDVDDFHGVTTTVTVQRNDQTGRDIRFTVTYSVRYVLPDAPATPSPGNNPTLAKEVTVNVVEEVDSDLGRTPVTCTLSQVVTPAWNALHG
ncbi:MAG TPA: hypothetical protein VK002_10880 [Rubricoccaceae bacterium]|jgi:hypothetical protein|nr:hypothetical protein [Rubricoccaceae bacterium]